MVCVLLTLQLFIGTYQNNVKNAGKSLDTRVTELIESSSDSSDKENSNIGTWIKLLNNDGYIRKRKIARIIRYRCYNKQQDPVNYYREQLMLYVLWRNEKLELLHENINIIAKYEENIDKIKEELLKNLQIFWMW